jgi:hypothetical protein
MKYLESYDGYGELNVVCDESCYSLASTYLNKLDKKSTISSKEGNSSVISAIKTLISKGSNNILVILDDRGELKDQMDERLDFLRGFMGERDYKKLDVKMVSELKISESKLYEEATFKKSDFNIYKIRVYADGIDVVKSKFDGDPIQHNERAKEYVDFFGKMVEKVTGQSMRYYYTKYMFFAKESVVELLKANYDIRVVEGEEYNWWFIPKENKEVSDWVENNCKLPFRKALRSPNFASLDSDSNDYWRKKAEELTKDYKMKNNL